MSENIEGAKNFINEHLVKILWGVSLYYLTQLAGDFKDVKTTLQAILVNQAVVEVRLTNKDSADKKQDERLDNLERYHNSAR